METTTYIGKPRSRTDGKKKVTGTAKYAAEFSAPGLLYGVVVSSGIAKGWITNFDLRKAQEILGVVKIFTHENRLRTPWFENRPSDELALPGSPFRPLYDEKVLFNQQPIALVVAEDFETARYAAGLVGVGYRIDQHETNLNLVRDAGHKPGHRLKTELQRFLLPLADLWMSWRVEGRRFTQIDFSEGCRVNLRFFHLRASRFAFF